MHGTCKKPSGGVLFWCKNPATLFTEKIGNPEQGFNFRVTDIQFSRNQVEGFNFSARTVRSYFLKNYVAWFLHIFSLKGVQF